MVEENEENEDKQNSFTRIIFSRYVHKKLNKKVAEYHVLSVIALLFDEMRQQFEDNKKIRIEHLGAIEMVEIPPQLFTNLFSKTQQMSRGNTKLRFKISPMVRNILCRLLDLDKTVPKT